MFSPTGYYANYRVIYLKESPDSDLPTITSSWYDTFPVISTEGGEAIVIDNDGKVKTTSGLLAEFQERQNQKDEDGEWFQASLEVTPADLSASEE